MTYVDFYGYRFYRNDNLVSFDGQSWEDCHDGKAFDRLVWRVDAVNDALGTTFGRERKNATARARRLVADFKVVARDVYKLSY